MRIYNDPANGDQSSIGTQLRTDHIIKTALIEAKKETYFGALADVTAMPKNMGKKIKRYQYVPMLDDANINDQGLNAAGLAGNFEATLVVTMADGSIPNIQRSSGVPIGNKVYFTGEAATAALASDACRDAFLTWANQAKVAGGLALAVTVDDAGFATAVNSTNGTAYALGFRFHTPAGAVVQAAPTLDTATVPAFGNLYGSSKDVGTIAGKLPVLSETGGKVNRVGFTRVELEGSLEKYGFYQDYTQESVDFDSDAELEMHVNREMIFGANEITEDMLQIDLLNAAGVVFYAGAAVSDATMTGVTANGITEVTYGDLSRLSVELDNNRCPKTTKVISGSRMVDTRVVRGGRVMFIGSELTETVERMTDYFGAQAFISVAHYADAGAPLNGEIGTVGQFRLVVVPEMMHWAGVGAAEGVNAGYRATGGKYDVFPMLVVGDGSFTTIGFQTSGNSVKFNIKHAKPGSPESYANDPYGETGFMSIKWYYGFMSLRSERIGLIKTVARI
jgi:N4-gp56 family major capsid protein